MLKPASAAPAPRLESTHGESSTRLLTRLPWCACSLQVAYPWGKASFEALKAAGADATFKTYPGMGHSACDEELAELVAFLKRVLPANAQ